MKALIYFLKYYSVFWACSRKFSKFQINRNASAREEFINFHKIAN